MLSDIEFEQLLQRTRDGDKQAAQQLVSLYEPEIRRAARMRLTDPRLRRLVDSIDICQSVFGRFFRSASDPSFEMQSSEQLLALLVTMTRNRVIDLHRRQTAQKRNPGEGRTEQYLLDAVTAEDPGPGTVTIARELVEEVQSRLSAEELQIAELRNAGHSWTEVAEQLGTSAETVRKRLERALARVRSEIEGTSWN